MDTQNLYIAVSYPNLNFNISRTLKWGSQVNGQERFYSVSTPVDIEVICKLIFLLFLLLFLEHCWFLQSDWLLVV